MDYQDQKHWHPVLMDPSGSRRKKPRQKGLTMVIDKGLGPRQFSDLLETSAAYMDMIKMGFGTSPLYPEPLLKRKIETAKEAGLYVMPGGTFFEVAVSQNQFQDYLKSVKAFGYNAIEISDGTIDIPLAERGEYIKQARSEGFTVFTEYGKKCWGSKLTIQTLIETIHQDLIHGSELVTVEGRESGKGVGIYDEDGKFNAGDIHEVLGQLPNPNVLLWEAPHKDQQIALLKELGPDVNLGNISPQDLYSLETLRRGLRSDTFDFGQKHPSLKP
jgi:phosphosulfolactate synthase